MASNSWQQYIDLECEFYQCLRLAEQAQQPIFLKPSKNISFPATDVRKVDTEGQVLELGFMGLYGVDAPLPQYLIETLSYQHEPAMSLRKLLDVINQRFYYLLYVAWKCRRPYILLETDDSFLNYLTAISGNSLTTDDNVEFAYAGLLGKRVKTCVGLEAIIKDYLHELANIIQFIPSWIRLEKQYLGTKQLMLGDNIVLGEQTLDINSTIRIIIGPMSKAKALGLFPGETQSKRLHRLIHNYLGNLISYELLLKIKSDGLHYLGQAKIYLGWTSTLGKNSRESYGIKLDSKELLNNRFLRILNNT